MSGDGELMITILASFAQEESLSVSENIKWRIRNDFKEGKPNTFSLYGYRWVEENAHRAMSQIKYEAEYAKRTEVYKRVNEKISELEKEKLIKKNKYKEEKTALSILKENNTPIQEFDSGLFFGLIENVVIKLNCILLFNFTDGSKVEYELQKGLKIRGVKNIKRG